MMRKILLWIVGGVLILVVLVVVLLTITEWRPKTKEVVYLAEHTREVRLKDTIFLLSWNIGYGGLGDDMDFFYDGGKRVRTSRERTIENLSEIVALLKRYEEVDFILLQEVDFDSKRSYGIDQLSMLAGALPNFEKVSAYNYVSPFVPIPLKSPMGRIRSGMVTFSKYPISKAVRYQYPSAFSYPVRLFNLKRALLSIEIHVPGGDTMFVNNTHNTAYDTGRMREKEMSFLAHWLEGKSLSITAGDWNSLPPGYVPSKQEIGDPYFSPTPIDSSIFVGKGRFAVDLSRPSVRYGYQPYKQGSTTTTILDFAFVGNRFKVVEVKTIDLQFKNSDHQPLLLKVVMR